MKSVGKDITKVKIFVIGFALQGEQRFDLRDPQHLVY